MGKTHLQSDEQNDLKEQGFTSELKITLTNLWAIDCSRQKCACFPDRFSFITSITVCHSAINIWRTFIPIVWPYLCTYSLWHVLSFKYNFSKMIKSNLNIIYGDICITVWESYRNSQHLTVTMANNSSSVAMFCGWPLFTKQYIFLRSHWFFPFLFSLSFFFDWLRWYLRYWVKTVAYHFRFGIVKMKLHEINLIKINDSS